MAELEHSYRGTTWKNHKYIRKENKRYIYSKTTKSAKNTGSAAIASGKSTIDYLKEKSKDYTKATIAAKRVISDTIRAGNAAISQLMIKKTLSECRFQRRERHHTM